MRACVFVCVSLIVATALAKKIETGMRAKHRRVHARQITRLCHVRAVVSIFLAKVVETMGTLHLTFLQNSHHKIIRSCFPMK